MRSVLLLSTYPIAQPRHGGQIRLANIAQAYSRAGWAVRGIAIYESEGYGRHVVGPHDIAFDPDSPYRRFRGRDVVLSNDLLTSVYGVADDGAFPKIAAALPKDLALIHVEQIWMWPIAHRIRSLPGFGHVKLVLGTQNIEADLKEGIFDSYGVVDGQDVIEAIRVLECRAIEEADLVLAVTQADLDFVRRLGAKESLLAPNGIAPWSASRENLDRWRERLPKVPWALYVASAHPPNFTDINRYFNGSLGCIPPDSRLVVVGSVCEHVYRELSATPWSSINLSRLDLLFQLDDEDLAAVKTLARLFVLPISVGGGSNIKTAEAIYSGAAVVGASTAFRGYEAFLDLPEVKIAEDGRQFSTFVRESLTALDDPAPDRSRRTALTWEHNLHLYIERADRLAAAGAPA